MTSTDRIIWTEKLDRAHAAACDDAIDVTRRDVIEALPAAQAALKRLYGEVRGPVEDFIELTRDLLALLDNRDCLDPVELRELRELVETLH